MKSVHFLWDIFVVANRHRLRLSQVCFHIRISNIFRIPFFGVFMIFTYERFFLQRKTLILTGNVVLKAVCCIIWKSFCLNIKFWKVVVLPFTIIYQWIISCQRKRFTRIMTTSYLFATNFSFNKVELLLRWKVWCMQSKLVFRFVAALWSPPIGQIRINLHSCKVTK